MSLDHRALRESLVLRPEAAADHAAVDVLIDAAFGAGAEGQLLTALFHAGAQATRPGAARFENRPDFVATLAAVAFFGVYGIANARAAYARITDEQRA